MEKEIHPDVIKSTQVSLGKYVKRPPLSEKLLKKPPFRFLHDIITSVLKTTGFFGNLFEEDELTSDNVKDRDSKIAFLNKVIFVLSSTTGKSISAKPSKIVAGQEPDKTNELLQCLAKALDDNLSSDVAVKKFKESIKSTDISENNIKESNKTVKKTNDPKKGPRSKSSEKHTNQKNEAVRSSNKQDKEKINENKSKKKEIASIKTDNPSKKSSQSKPISKKNIKEPVKEEVNLLRNKNIIPNNIEKDKMQNPLTKHGSQDLDLSLQQEDLMGAKLIVNEEEPPNIEPNDQEKLNASYTIVENDLNSSSSTNELIESANIVTEGIKSLENNVVHDASISDRRLDIEHNHDVNQTKLKQDIHEYSYTDTVLIKKDLASRTEKENEISIDVVKGQPPPPPLSSGSDTSNILRPPSVRPSSSRPGAPRMREKNDNVIKDTDNLLLGKVNIIVENTQNEEEEDVNLMVIDQQEGSVTSPSEQQELKLLSNEHGHLVQQILDSQKELSHMTGKTEIEWQFGVQKAREAVNQEVEQLRFNIQALSRVTNPLRKLLDHVQEDVEVMRQELQQWVNIYEDVSKEMIKQKTLNEDSLTPFHTKLKQLESDIEEKHDKINDLKVLIHKNAFKIEKLLANGNLQ